MQTYPVGLLVGAVLAHDKGLAACNLGVAVVGKEHGHVVAWFVQVKLGRSLRLLGVLPPERTRLSVPVGVVDAYPCRCAHGGSCIADGHSASLLDKTGRGFHCGRLAGRAAYGKRARGREGRPL